MASVFLSETGLLVPRRNRPCA